jgi:hypothetical protein
LDGAGALILNTAANFPAKRRKGAVEFDEQLPRAVAKGGAMVIERVVIDVEEWLRTIGGPAVEGGPHVGAIELQFGG